MPSRISSFAFAVTVLALSACGGGFDPRSLADRTQVLGIIAEPPEPSFAEESELRVIVSLPEEVESYTWSSCPFTLGALAGYVCAAPELERPIAAGDTWDNEARLRGADLDAGLAMLAPMFSELLEELESADKGECEQAVFDDYDACSEAGRVESDEEACVAAAYAGYVQCLHVEGMEIQARVVVLWKDGTRVEAVKRVRFRDASAERPANKNPVLYGLELEEQLILDGEVLRVAPGESLEFVPVITSDGANSVETYVDEEGETQEELVFFTWFANDGKLDHEHTNVDYPDNKWHAPGLSDSGEAPDPITLWALVRDDRLGANVLSLRLVVDPSLAEGFERADEVAP